MPPIGSEAPHVAALAFLWPYALGAALLVVLLVWALL